MNRSYHPRFPFADMPAAVEYSLQVIRETYESEERNPGRQPLWGAFSGGKDSVVIKQLVIEAGVPCDWHYGVTTIDPPEVIRFMHRHHPDVVPMVNEKYRNFAELIEKRGFPLRQRRKCCAAFKERPAPDGRVTLLGIRAEESARRRAAWLVWNKPRGKTIGGRLCPILYWSEADVWEFIRSRELPYCTLYDSGFQRLGCIACPMASPKRRIQELQRWPYVERLLRKGFHGLWDRIGPSHLYHRLFLNSDAMFEWWLSDAPMPKEVR